MSFIRETLSTWRRRPAGAAVAAVLAGTAALGAPPAAAQQAAQQIVATRDDVHAGDMTVPVHKSQVLRLSRPYVELAVGNSEIADVLPLTDRSIYVLGKALGSTNLSVYGRGKQLLAVVDLNVGHDVEGLKARLHELMPGAAIEVRAVNDSVVLSGGVASAEQAARAVAIAERYAPERVSNLLKVRGSQQVMLAVRIAEVSRTMARELGIKPNFLIGEPGDENFVFNVLDGLATSRFGVPILGVSTTAFGVAQGQVRAGEFALDFIIDALEERGLVKVLAEPNLVALSGETAGFLAGGEFPIPVAQEADRNGLAITVEFKQFGVSLAFTPTVIDEDLINLKVEPEVSQIDPTTAVTVAGFSIPGLSTRRAGTTVELRDGQSLAIAGLLQSDFQDQLQGLPGLSNLPVLGAMFRSTEFQRRETELVIIVTPKLVQPVAAGALAAPTDYFVPPSDIDLFLHGRVEAPGPLPLAASGQAAVLGAEAGGGVDGRYGHIVK